MRRSITLATLAVVLAGPASQFGTLATGATAGAPSAYVQAVLKDKPVALLQGMTDLTGTGGAGTAVGAPAATTLPNGDPAVQFNGKGQYLSFADRKAFEIDSTGALTVEFWMRPDVLQFADMEGSGYVYTLGKGTGNAHEWYARMYSKTNSESRPNRISGYSFNPAGGLGAGSYFEDPVTVGQWIHVALVINSTARTSQYPTGYTRIYKNGVLRDTDSLQGYNIVPRSGTAPLRIGTGYLDSFFQGAIGDVAFYDHELTAAQLQTHRAAIRTPAPTPTPTTQTSAPVRNTTIMVRWRAIGGYASVLGGPRAREYSVAGGRVRHFQKGRIYAKQGVGAHELYGKVLKAFLRRGATSSQLGFPRTAPGHFKGGTYARFENGVLQVFRSGRVRVIRS